MEKYEILRKYRKMKLSEFVESVFGIKLMWYQKIFVDKILKFRKKMPWI